VTWQPPIAAQTTIQETNEVVTNVTTDPSKEQTNKIVQVTTTQPVEDAQVITPEEE